MQLKMQRQGSAWAALGCTILRSTTEGRRTWSPNRHLRGGKGKGRREKAVVAAAGDQIRMR